MCLNPKKICRRGNYKENTYNGKKGEEYDVTTWQKCGHCEECLAEKANNWVIRNYYESQCHKDKCFITLTYKDNPKILIKRDLQLFFKRFRKKLELKNIKVKYFAVGEYGTKNHRPHYHAIIYGWKEDKDKLTYKGLNKKNNILMESETIKEAWGKGITSYQEFDEHEIPYICIYESPNEDIKKKHLFAKQKLIEMINNNPQRYMEYLGKFDKIKSNFIEIKEFNLWSLSMGFEKWLEDYENTSKTFQEYIENKEFSTPTPWIKKMANLGEKRAIEEMKKRQEEQRCKAYVSTEKMKAIKNNKRIEKHIQDVLNYNKDINRLEDF